MIRIICLLLLVLLSYSALATPILRKHARIHPVTAPHIMVSSQDAIASQIGLDILNAGGNAVDAGIAVAYALAVTLPKAGNIGGGGFMLYYDAENKTVTALDYRETAPRRATKDMFLDPSGTPDPQKSQFSLLSVGVPGTIAGLEKAHQLWGSRPFKTLITPAIRLAKKGFRVTPYLSTSLKQAMPRFKNDPYTLSLFTKKDGTVYEPGDIFVQKDLAKTLTAIKRDGASAFYTGPIAKKIISFFKEEGGLIQNTDLSQYTPHIRTPIKGHYKDYTVYAMPPPSSGGVHLIQLLNILASFSLKEMGHNSARYIQTLTESMKFAYADRANYLGDPDFVKVPQNALISKAYAKSIVRHIKSKGLSPSPSIHSGQYLPKESDETTHFSIVDREGNIVTNTYTLNFSYGTHIAVPNTGFLLNNQMDDFTSKVGTPNAYGLIGSEANAIEPKKRMLSSMTPSLVFKNDRPILVTGSPGGSRIITSVLQLILNVLEFDMNIAEATLAPRIHHQWMPDILFIESGISPDTQALLKQMGYHIKAGRSMGGTQSIRIHNNTVSGFSDPRKPESLTLGE